MLNSYGGLIYYLEPEVKPGLAERGQQRMRYNLLKRLERERGFEPPTLALARRCSTTELFPPDFLSNYLKSLPNNMCSLYVGIFVTLRPHF